MGGATSKFSETDWETVDAGLKNASETIDESKPTSQHSIITLTKHSIVNQREYDVKDDEGTLLYTTKAVEGTVKWFDLLDKDGTKTFRVQTDQSHKNWDIYRYGKPTFEGQEADTEASEKAGESLYKKAGVTVAWDRYHGTVAMYGPDQKPTGEDGKGESEREGSATGVLMSDDPVLKVEEIKSITGEYQTMLPSHGMLGFDNREDREKKGHHHALVGYWVWEHTNKTHKIKMHIGKGTDLALHVILAVLTNMIRTERNAMESS